ncbi:MAG: hypothetical protein FJZ59_01160 [Chlamydiae bacterium]|nr:hypothetical protein [Chlamydiota bacterium]
MMEELIKDLKTYLLENFTDKKDLLFLKSIPFLEPVKKTQAPPVKKFITPSYIKKEKPLNETVIIEEPIAQDVVVPPPSFIAEKPKVALLSQDKEMHALYTKIAPSLKLFDKPLDDAVAKQIRIASNKRSDIPEIPVFFDHSIQEHLDFLTNLAKAINTSFGKSSVVNIHEFEEKNLWKPLLAHSQIRLIITPSSLLKHSPNLQTITKEYPGRLLKSVLKIPLFALTDIQNTSIRKKEIWGILTKFFSKQKS